jgi:hypothetical protein
MEDAGGQSNQKFFEVPECLLWVKTGKAPCEHMFSALPPKADIPLRTRYVRFVPQADSCAVVSHQHLITSSARANR